MEALQSVDSRINNEDFLHQVQDAYSLELQGVNDVLRHTLSSIAPQVPEIASYVIRSGGKRLRPMLSIIAGRVFSDSHEISSKLTRLAAGIECIHTATLLHDDVVDEGMMRRGRPSANAVWGNALSVLVGDFLLSRAFDLIVGLESLEVVKIMSVTAGNIAEGEVLQLTNHNNLQLNQDQYFKMIEAKTARLFSSGVRSAAVVAGAGPDAQESLFAYGNYLGILFQLIDDSLDYLGSTSTMGKNQGDDFREAKVTLPVLLAYERGDNAQREFWERTFVQKDQESDDFLTALKYMRQHHVFDQVMASCYKYAELAKQALANLPRGKSLDFLYEMVDFCLARKK